MANAGTTTRPKRSRRSGGSTSSGSSERINAGSAAGTTSGTTGAVRGGSNLSPNDRVIVQVPGRGNKHNGSATITRSGDAVRAVGYVEYRCDCHKQFHICKEEHVKRLKPKQ